MDSTDWDDELGALMEDEQWNAWDEYTLAQYRGDTYVPRIESDEDFNLSDSDEWAKRYFAKETTNQPTYGRPTEPSQHPNISSDSTNKEIIEAYEDSGLHWKEVPMEVRFMRIVEEMSAIYRLWWKNLGS